MRPRERVFVDTGAFVALAVVRDAYHPRAVEYWEKLSRHGARIVTSVPVVLETYTYLDRKGSRELADVWRVELANVRPLVLSCSADDLKAAWAWLERKELRRLSLVDATSFALMTKHELAVAFTFDTHFAIAGFRCEA